MSTIFFNAQELASFANCLVINGIDRNEAIKQISNAAMQNCVAYNIRYNECETPVSRDEIVKEIASTPAAKDCGSLVYNCDGLLNPQQEQLFSMELGGVMIAQPPAVKNEIESTIRESFDFTIDKFRLSGPDNMPTPHFGLFRSDSGECVGNACSEKYEPHTVDDLVALASAGSAAFDGECKVNCNWRSGHYLTISPSDDYRQSIYGTSDNIFPRLIISAGYDGKAFRGSLGMYRDACRNLAMVREAGDRVSASIKHTTGLRENVDELTTQFAALAAKWSGVVSTVHRMESTQVNLADFLATVYPDSETDSTRTKNAQRRRIQSIFTRVVQERRETGRPEIGNDWMVSAWEAFNGVQGYTQHDKNRKGSPSNFDRAVMAFTDPAVIAAESLALNA